MTDEESVVFKRLVREAVREELDEQVRRHHEGLRLYGVAKEAALAAQAKALGVEPLLVQCAKCRKVVAKAITDTAGVCKYCWDEAIK